MAQAAKPPPKTGDDLIDQDAMATRRQKVIRLHGIMSDDWHVGALNDSLLSRLEARRACLYADGGERFPRATWWEPWTGIGAMTSG